MSPWCSATRPACRRCSPPTGRRPDGPATLVEAFGADILERGFAGDELSTDDAGSEAFRERIDAYGARSGLALPIPTSRAPAGVLYVLFDDTDTIDPQYRELARALAAQAGLAVELLTAREDLARQTRVTSALLTVSERLATLTDPREVPGTLVAAIRVATGASLAAVARWSEANQRVEFAAIEGLTPEEQAGLLALDPGPELGIVQGGLEGRSAVFVAPFDPVDIPIAFAEAMGITAIAGAPITAGGDVWGFLLVATRPGDPSIVETGAELLRGFATITATAVGRTQAIALLERSHDALESAVAERTFELTQVVEELSRANRAKTEFLANVSHELRTPLTAIVGFTDLLLHGMEGPLTEAQREDLRTIDSSGGRLLGLIDNLIEVSDIEAGRVELRIEPVALTPFLQERATEIRSFAGHKQQSVELESGRGPAIIYADEGRLRTVLRNLLSNAVKFTPAHGTIRIEAAGTRGRRPDRRRRHGDRHLPGRPGADLRTVSSRLRPGRAGNRPRPRDRARVRPAPRRRPHGRVDTWYREPVQRLAARCRRIADLASPGRLMSRRPSAARPRGRRRPRHAAADAARPRTGRPGRRRGRHRRGGTRHHRARATRPRRARPAAARHDRVRCGPLDPRPCGSGHREDQASCLLRVGPAGGSARGARRRSRRLRRQAVRGERVRRARAAAARRTSAGLIVATRRP